MQFRSSQVTVLEQQLRLENVSSQQRFKNITSDELKNAAEMLIYLGTCPQDGFIDWFGSWYNFYDDLFKTESPKNIILTLNRIMNSENSQIENFQKWNERLFKGSAKILSLKYQVIQSMLPRRSKYSLFEDYEQISATLGESTSCPKYQNIG